MAVLENRKNDWYSRTEKELYALPRLKIRLENLLSLLAELYPNATRELVAVGGGGLSDSTQTCVQRRQELEEEARAVRERIARIEKSIETLLPEEKELLTLIYHPGQYWFVTCRQLGLSKSAYYRQKNAIVKKIAICLGFLPSDNLGKNRE